jgi:hypothetical protein
MFSHGLTGVAGSHILWYCSYYSGCEQCIYVPLRRPVCWVASLPDLLALHSGVVPHPLLACLLLVAFSQLPVSLLLFTIVWH